MDALVANEIYKYQSLPDRTIRLLKIHPGSRPTPGGIDIEIEVHNIDQCPPYTSLSYTWGEAGEEVQISIAGKKFFVRKNLIAFLMIEVTKSLKGLENHAGDLFWIDQLAIDQSNVKERNHQVGLMRDIYSNASLVIVWLGSGSNKSDQAMEFNKEKDRPTPKTEDEKSPRCRVPRLIW